MFSGKFLQAAGMAALAAALMVTALPASAQDRGNVREARSAERGSSNQGARSGGSFERRAQAQRSQQRTTVRTDQRRQQRPAQIERRAERRAAQVDRRSEQRAARVERQGDRAAAQAAWQGNRNQARQIDRRSEQAARQIERRGDWRAQQIERRGDNRQDRADRRVERRDNEWRGDARRAANNNDRWRNDNNNRWRNDNNSWRGNDRRNDRRWDRRWRDNNRYDWQRYRNTNRVVFRLGTYYAPYRNYSYRRVNVGYRLDSLFFGSRYWISSPWQYRLPEVYGPYRWVRYYNDVLLVDIYSGEVVDVIHDFFW